MQTHVRIIKAFSPDVIDFPISQLWGILRGDMTETLMIGLLKPIVDSFVFEPVSTSKETVTSRLVQVTMKLTSVTNCWKPNSIVYTV